MSCEINTNATLITVHGREGLLLPYTKFTTATNGKEIQTDISASTIYLEIPSIDLRRQLVVNPADPLGLLIKLLRADVENIPTSSVKFAIINETSEIPDVEWEAEIVRTGYTGEPTNGS